MSVDILKIHFNFERNIEQVSIHGLKILSWGMWIYPAYQQSSGSKPFANVKGERETLANEFCVFGLVSQKYWNTMFWVSPSVLLQLLPMRTQCAHWRRTFDSINALQAFYRMCQNFSLDETFFPVLYSGPIWIQTVCQWRERERERERPCMPIFSGKSK